MREGSCAKTLHDDFSGARQAGHGIEIARIKEQRRRDEFIDRALDITPFGNRTQIARKAPS
jgi:hypothetical protein